MPQVSLHLVRKQKRQVAGPSRPTGVPGVSDDDDQERRGVPLEAQMPAPSAVGCERCQQLTVESWLHRSGLTTGYRLPPLVERGEPEKPAGRSAEQTSHHGTLHSLRTPQMPAVLRPRRAESPDRSRVMRHQSEAYGRGLRVRRAARPPATVGTARRLHLPVRAEMRSPMQHDPATGRSRRSATPRYPYRPERKAPSVQSGQRLV